MEMIYRPDMCNIRYAFLLSLSADYTLTFSDDSHEEDASIYGEIRLLPKTVSMDLRGEP